MRITVRIGLLFALIWITLKMIFLWGEFFKYDIVPAVMLNMLCLLLAVAVGLYLHKKEEKEYGNALNDIKNGLSAAMPYALVVGVFIYFYYSKIDPDYNAHQIADAKYEIQKLVDNPETLAEVKASNEEFEVKTKEEIYGELVKGPESFYNPTSTMTISLLAMLLLGTLNSIFVTVIYRKTIFRNR